MIVAKSHATLERMTCSLTAVHACCRDDDEMRTMLRAHITATMPVELVLPKGHLSSMTSKVLRGCLRNPRINELPGGGDGSTCGGAWDAQGAVQMLGKHYSPNAEEDGHNSWPLLLKVGRSLCGWFQLSRC